MLLNYVKIAQRNILKNRFYSILNITGLATGIAFAMLIMAYVWSELQVNANLKNASNQYIIQSKWKDPNMGFELATFGPLAKALREQYPTLVKNYYRWDGVTTNATAGEKKFRQGLQIGDSTFLTMYGFKVLYGDAATALNDPYSMVLTEEVAKKYFGTADAIGKIINLESFSGGKHDFQVTAVIRINGKNSVTSLTDDNDNGCYLSAKAFPFFGRDMESWNNPYIANLLELQDGITAEQLAKPMAALVRQNTAAQVADNIQPYAVALKDYYLQKDNRLVSRMLYTLSGVALFILLMAVINFVNISVSRSSTRMKEIGVRKVLGSLKKQLIWQFLIESTILVFISAILAFMLYLAMKSTFSQILNKPIPSLNEFPLYFIVFPLLLICLTGLAAGLYPAFVLSSLKSVDSLKGTLRSVKENVIMRKSLVAFQFFTAAIVLIGAFIITKQIQLFFSKNIGYDKEYVVSAQVPRDWTPKGVNQMQGLRAQFAAMPEVKAVTLSFEIPDGGNSGNMNVYRATADSATAVASYVLSTDEYYADTYGIPMAAGKYFNDPGMYTDSSKVVINEKMATSLGWKTPADAIGQQLKLIGNNSLCTIAGVTKDFHFSSMQKAVQPLLFINVRSMTIFRYFSFKLKGPDAIKAVQQKWAALIPGAPFEYKFTDDILANMYRTEVQLKQAAYTATVLSFIIVLLGVTGMISLSIQKRRKEIGIRKVLGSSVNGIISLFVKEFTVVILVAGLVACPVAYIIMQHWLNDYVYRIDITALPFVLTISVLVAITGILIILQTAKAASANPINSLRSE